MILEFEQVTCKELFHTHPHEQDEAVDNEGKST